MYFSMLKKNPWLMGSCRRCMQCWICNTQGLSSYRQSHSQSSKTSTVASVGRSLPLLNNLAHYLREKLGKVSTGCLASKHVSTLWYISKRDFYIGRNTSLEHSVKLSRQGCPYQKSRLHSSGIVISERITKHQTRNDHDVEGREWQLPTGTDTGIQMYNSITKKKEPFILPKGNIATWYACGPTVYDHAHIGHASSYVRSDIIRRILINYFNIDVVMVMGVTDIDDKIINRSKESGISCRQLTHMFEEQFFKDMDELNVMAPTIKTRVTEHISNIIYFISKLVNQGFGYITPSGTVYFDVKQYGRYGRLWTHRLDTEIRGALDKDKKGPRDFALWKSAKPDEPSWDSPWGKGRPGWHIECSTMATSIFGESLDIHSGGDDLRFPHHENEMAQSEACLCTKQWTNYWMHTGHLHLRSDTAKMSKSLNNTIRINELLSKATASQFRIFCMLIPYHQHIEFSPESLLKAVKIHDSFMSFMSLAEAYIYGQVHTTVINEPLLLETLLETKRKVHNAMSDDFNTAKAIQALELLVRKANIELGQRSGQEEPFVSRSVGTVAAVLEYVDRILNVWGVQHSRNKLLNQVSATLGGTSDSDIMFKNVMDSMITFRSKIRDFALNPQEDLLHDEPKIGDELTPKQKKKLALTKVRPLFNACDELRDDLKLNGIIIQDHAKGARWDIEDKNAKLGTTDVGQPSTQLPKNID